MKKWEGIFFLVESGESSSESFFEKNKIPVGSIRQHGFFFFSKSQKGKISVFH